MLVLVLLLGAVCCVSRTLCKGLLSGECELPLIDRSTDHLRHDWVRLAV